MPTNNEHAQCTEIDRRAFAIVVHLSALTDAESMTMKQERSRYSVRVRSCLGSCGLADTRISSCSRGGNGLLSHEASICLTPYPAVYVGVASWEPGVRSRYIQYIANHTLSCPATLATETIRYLDIRLEEQWSSGFCKYACWCGQRYARPTPPKSVLKSQGCRHVCDQAHRLTQYLLRATSIDLYHHSFGVDHPRKSSNPNLAGRATPQAHSASSFDQ